MATLIAFPTDTAPYKAQQFKSSGSLELVDGVVVDPETYQMTAVQGWIRLDNRVVLNPENYAPLPIGILFFPSKQEALKGLIKSFKESIGQLHAFIQKLEEELTHDQ